MTKVKILQEGQSYSFRSYFELSYEPEEILAEFGYSLIRSRLALPKTTRQLDRLPDLKQASFAQNHKAVRPAARFEATYRGHLTFY